MSITGHRCFQLCWWSFSNVSHTIAFRIVLKEFLKSIKNKGCSLGWLFSIMTHTRMRSVVLCLGWKFSCFTTLLMSFSAHSLPPSDNWGTAFYSLHVCLDPVIWAILAKTWLLFDLVLHALGQSHSNISAAFHFEVFHGSHYLILKSFYEHDEKPVNQGSFILYV